ncbi:glycoside hydrolase family 43 protein [[Clostridium] polysaccharolyticum]|uniref:Alpha-N-arabinofuranosidase n=1 Tax=[Clostridium] polysaccharolyticum TaxID=29364 RepID=A0A1I0DR54_9FIRM|nr:glycoside hydrolase family 43 protein [[Clostridium] polysaccharolyticum]SET34873.1 alpha-N-arabinofuranosidase [[Clostridium] polysaccharolyticum]
MIYNNPVIAGFHPDPSICRVGDDFYLVNSTFEYFPGIPVYHSKDLVNWQQIGHCITRNEQLALSKGQPNGSGLFAPAIRYHDGIFYVICTNVTYDDTYGGNFIVWSENPEGDWSDPVYIDAQGIDPSLFFDEDGKVYYTGTNNGIYLCEINPKTGEILGEKQYIWEGSGGSNPEGPHIYKKDGWYYLLISEGGTEYGHMITMARSEKIAGPYVACEKNPVLTNRSLDTPVKAVGHADLVDDADGNWWAVCLGIRPLGYPFRHNLGRETMLVPVTWESGEWPLFGENGMLPLTVETDKLNGKQNERKGVYQEHFHTKELAPCWNFIYNPVSELYKIENEGLVLYGNECSLSEADSLAWVGRRQEDHECIARTQVIFEREQDGEEAGITIYMNNLHHYEAALTRIDDKGYIILRRQIGSLWKIERQIPYVKDKVVFELHCSKEFYTFWYGESKEELKFLGKGETDYLTTEVGGRFTGNYIGLYAAGNGNRCRKGAKFRWFEYQV